jgi:hypothetical protein
MCVDVNDQTYQWYHTTKESALATVTERQESRIAEGPTKNILF